MKAWLFLLAALPGLATSAPVVFGDRLQAKFQHDRCLECHQFNSAKNNGRNFHSHRSRYLCSQCHSTAVTGLGPSDWFAPEARLDHTRMSAKNTCQLIKRSFGGDDRRLIEHLLHDDRVRWALESGMTPGGQKERVPGGFAEWEKDVKEWVRDGLRCE